MAATGQPESRNNKRATTVNGNANEEVDESDREFVTSNDATIQNTCSKNASQIGMSPVSNVTTENSFSSNSSSSSSSSSCIVPECNKSKKVNWGFSDADFEFEENDDEVAKQLELLSSNANRSSNSLVQKGKPTDIDVTVSMNSLNIISGAIFGNCYSLKEFLKGTEPFGTT